MIDAIIQFSVRNKLLVGILVMGLVGWGLYSMTQLPVDAVPDITNNQVQVVTISPTLAPQEIEQYVTFPVELAMANIQGVVEIRSISKFGLSVVTVVFDEGMPTLDARQLVSEQIAVAVADIPPDMGTPEMMPITTGLGEIFQYTLEPQPGYEDEYDPMKLRTIQDWLVKRYLSGIPGIVEISSFGGFVRQYEVSIDPERLRSMNISLEEVFNALEKNNQNSGGAYIEKDGEALYIRAEGLMRNQAAIEQTLVKLENGRPVLIRDLAQVKPGHMARFGAMTQDGKGEAVGGITLMLKGANSNEVISQVQARIAEVEKILPEGLAIEPYLDRSELVHRAIATVRNNLIEGGLIVIFILVLLLGNIRAGLIVASLIPLSLLFAFGMMNLFGVSANLMSLGAIDFGLIVDGAVIIVESIVHNITNRFAGMTITRDQLNDQVIDSTIKIRKSAAFGEIIILMVYIPILALEGIEGKMFGPMAQTVSFAILGALILSLTYVPMASSTFLPRKVSSGRSLADRIISRFIRMYEPLLQKALDYRKLVISLAVLLFLGSIWIFSRMGGEFIPQLDEGDMAMQMTVPTGSALSHTVTMSTRAEAILLREFPEVKKVVSKIGTAEVPTDPMSVEDADVMILMAPRKDWVSASSRAEMANLMKASLAPLEEEGAAFEFTQPIELRFNELLTGAKSDIAVKIYGDDLSVLATQGNAAAGIIRNIEGAADVRVDRTEGFPQIMIHYNRERMARYGLDISSVNHIIRSAFAGGVAGEVFEGEKRFDLVVRLNEQYRKDITHINNLMIRLPGGFQIPVREIATVNVEEGPVQISRDNTRRQITVGVNVRDRDVESLVNEIQARLESDLRLPPGYEIRYGGEFENLASARDRLMIAVPIALALIFILLYFTFQSLTQALLIFTAIPLSAIGGILALWSRGMPFSISAGVGFIALFGVAVLNGIVLIGYFNQLRKEGIEDIRERIIMGGRVRLRPVIMTAAVASLGFLPMALSTTSGAEVQRPLATVVIGGLVTATLLTLFILPALYSLVESGGKRRRLSKGGTTAGVIVLFMALPLFSSAQERPVSQDEALEIAWENHPEMILARKNASQAEVRKKTAWDLGETAFSYQYGQINAPVMDYQININQSLGKPFEMAARSKLLEFQQGYYQTAIDQIRLKVRREVMLLFETRSWTSEKLSVLEALTPAYENLSRITTIRSENGEESLSAQLEAEIALGELEMDIVELETRQEELLYRLRQLLGNEGVVFEERNPFAPLVWEDSITGVTPANNPTLRLMEQNIGVQSRELLVRKRALSPGLQAGYFTQQIEGVTGLDGFVIGVNFPLWFPSRTSRIQEARIETESAGKLLEYQQTSLKHELFLLQQQESQRRERMNFYRNQALPKARQMVRLAEERYQQGEQEFASYLQQLIRQFKVEMAHIDAIHQYNQTVIQLQTMVD